MSTNRRAVALLATTLALVAGCADDGAGATTIPVEVTHIGNAGFLVSAAGKTVLIDALYGEGVAGYATVSPELREILGAAAAPFDRVDVALATHEHPDHFDAPLICAHLTANPSVRFGSNAQAVGLLRASCADFDAASFRVQSLSPAPGQRPVLRHAGIRVEALPLHHGRGATVENLAFLLDLGGLRVLHLGDAQADAGEMRAAGLGAESIDVAFIPFWYLLDERWRPAVEQVIRPRRLIVTHVPPPGANDAYLERFGGWDGLVANVRRDFPAAVFFDAEMQSRLF